MKKKAIIALCAIFLTLPTGTEASVSSLDLSNILHVHEDDSSRNNYTAYHVNRKTHYRSSSAFQSMDVNYDGEIRVTDNDRGIKSISPGGYLKIRIRTFGNNRELLVNSNSRGELSYEYREGKKEVPYEPEGRKWLEDVLLDVVRSTSVDAAGRTERFYSRGGLDAFLDEVSHIRSSSVQSAYFTALLESEKLSDRELSELCFAIAGKISSNTEKGRLFRKFAGDFLRSPEVAAAYFSSLSKITSSTEKGRIYRNIDKPLDFNNGALQDAYFTGVDRISSNTEAGSVLRHTLEYQDLPAPAQAALCRSVAKISSNSESGRVLKNGEFDLTNPQVREGYFAALDRISSNTEAGSVLRHTLTANKVEGASMKALLNSTKKLSSSTVISSVIRTIREIDLGDAGIREAYFNVIRLTSSDSEAGRMLRYTLDNHTLNQASMIQLYETNQRISSNTEKSSVLRASIPHLLYEEAVLNAFFSCTNLLTSSTEHGRVLRELAKVPGLNREAVEGIIYSARRISSSTEKGSSLRSVAPMVREGDEALKDLYMEAARTLSSDTEFRRAVDAIM